MLDFELTQEPPTGPELQEKTSRVKQLRATCIKYSCISDVAHAFVFISLYFGRSLSGTAALVAVGIATFAALFTATVPKWKLFPLILTMTAVTTVVLCYYMLKLGMGQNTTGSIVAAATGGSIVLVGGTLGRRVKQVLIDLEDLRPIIDDERATQEVASLCRSYPELADYRETAMQNLRPHLCYGELKAMREWTRQRQQP